jgi:hypothetical protein
MPIAGVDKYYGHFTAGDGTKLTISSSGVEMIYAGYDSNFRKNSRFVAPATFVSSGMEMLQALQNGTTGIYSSDLMYCYKNGPDGGYDLTEDTLGSYVAGYDYSRFCDQHYTVEGKKAVLVFFRVEKRPDVPQDPGGCQYSTVDTTALSVELDTANGPAVQQLTGVVLPDVPYNLYTSGCREDWYVQLPAFSDELTFNRDR